MHADEEGFLYPVTNEEKCVKCGVCESLCPVFNKPSISIDPFNAVAFACVNKNQNVRLKSSSGGIFSLIAERVLASGGVVFGVAFDENFHVEHRYAETRENAMAFRQSKYVQSWIGDVYRQVEIFLKQRRLVLFCGTPCQTAGLHAYLGGTHDLLLTQDLICHGVSSPRVWESYLAMHKRRAASVIKDVHFRNKSRGWRQISVKITFESGKEYCRTYSTDLFMRGFLAGLYLRPSCYACAFKTIHRQTDFTLADFWGVQHLCPELDDNKGTSLVFVNTLKGIDLFRSIMDDMLAMPVDTVNSARFNPSMEHSAALPKDRGIFFDRFREEGIAAVKGFCKITLLRKIKTFFRDFFRRVYFMFHSGLPEK
ncbi:MAG: Coenzyme F420 hydrogenase/dehydrogenase, beta subunit C-terminal domain [Synergistaceae bacterium]|jgi:coenzyme F420-reducing hydrogenase beta subunit|nr:Coenzyme F420 hydrogenase/dehydrogenase, beta subunit C-terminal domain [Synergistaceae bacterium]